jgi:hypothetical protein
MSRDGNTPTAPEAVGDQRRELRKRLGTCSPGPRMDRGRVSPRTISSGE